MFRLESQQAALHQLNQAIYGHEQWHREIVRTLCTGLPYDAREVAEDAHCKCRFGQWYYGVTDQGLRDHPAFVALAGPHERMHRIAAQLLRTSAAGSPVPPADFDNFSNTLERLRLEIHALKNGIEEALRNRDPLTGAENRVSMLAKLREAHELVRRNIGPCCVTMMDLDHFKAINDTHGHPVGDQVLSASAAYVMEHLRPYDKMFRYGGEEFLITMPNIDLQAGQAAIERIRNGLAATALASGSGKPVLATASFGIALLDPDASVEESLDRADKALYAAKTGGRNRVCAWDPSMARDAVR